MKQDRDQTDKGRRKEMERKGVYLTSKKRDNGCGQ